MKTKNLTLSERAKHWRSKYKTIERETIRLRRQNKLLKDKLEFLQVSRSQSVSWGRGKWLSILKKHRRETK